VEQENPIGEEDSRYLCGLNLGWQRTYVDPTVWRKFIGQENAWKLARNLFLFLGEIKYLNENSR
jgi:hypothetical protein